MLRSSEQLPLQRTWLADALLGACLALLTAQMWRPSASLVTSMCSLRMSPSTSRTRSLMRHTQLITYRSAHHSQRLHGNGLSRTATFPHLKSHPHYDRSTLVGRCFHAKSNTTLQVHGIEARAKKRRYTPVRAQLSSHFCLPPASCLLSLRVREPHRYFHAISPA